MKKRIFVTDAVDLVGIVEDSILNDMNREADLGSEDLTNYWVNDILRASGLVPVARQYRHLDEVETYCTLTPGDVVEFTDQLFHMIKLLDLTEFGNPMVYHEITKGQLEFFIMRG